MGLSLNIRAALIKDYRHYYSAVVSSWCSGKILCADKSTKTVSHPPATPTSPSSPWSLLRRLLPSNPTVKLGHCHMHAMPKYLPKKLLLRSRPPTYRACVLMFSRVHASVIINDDRRRYLRSDKFLVLFDIGKYCCLQWEAPVYTLCVCACVWPPLCHPVPATKQHHRHTLITQGIKQSMDLSLFSPLISCRFWVSV